MKTKPLTFILALIVSCILLGCAGGNPYYNHGTDLLNNRDYHKAIPYFLESIRIDPNYAPAYVNLGNAYRGQVVFPF